MKKKELKKRIISLQNTLKILLEEPESTKAKVIKYRHLLSETLSNANWVKMGMEPQTKVKG